ncbi:MAG: hypothetical protein K2X80_16575 [Pseudomonadaceae bacterium]|nr:hypothetical protein [Pseudomonadaceae bacterium]
MKKAFLYLAATLAGAAITAAIAYQGAIEMDKEFAFRLKEPALIASPSGQQRYLLPASTVVYHQAGFAEGHSLYAIEVMFDGQLQLERLKQGESAEPLWLYNVETEDVKKLLNEYPLSKEDLVSILKARKITREELEQIVLDWAD